MGRHAEAVEAFRAAPAAGVLSLDGLLALAASLAALGRDDAAREALDGAVTLFPDAPAARFHRGMFRLARRDFAAWDDYEARLGVDRFLAESRGQIAPGLVPALTVGPSREALAGRRVLVVGEQGIGDQVMFASMLPDLLRTAAGVTLVCEPRLVGLFRASFPEATVLSPHGAAIDAEAVDVVIAMGSLGGAFRREAGAFPGTPYLAPRPEVVARWAERLGPRRGRRIGLSWRGGAPVTRRSARSLQLPDLTPIMALPGCEFVSLQYGEVADEVAAFPQLRAFPRAEIDDFEELAGLVANLDAVVSVQTALVHLCGATGARCLTLVPRHAEWRYMTQGESMPWYGSVRLFRQAAPGDWEPVIARAAAALR
jgi:hypothetical protein